MNPPAAPSPSDRSYALYSDPARERKFAIRMTAVALFMLLLLALAIGDIVRNGFALRSIPFLVIGLGGGAVSGLMAINGFLLAKQTGEDLLTLAVEGGGLAGPDGVRIPWQAVSGIEHITHGKAQRSTGHAPRSVRIHVFDHDRLATDLTDDQKTYLTATTGGQGRVDIGLGAVTEEEFAQLVDALGSAATQRNLALREGSPDPS